MNGYSKAKELLAKYNKGTLTEEEQSIVDKWYDNYAMSREKEPDPLDSEQAMDEVWVRLSDRTDKAPDRRTVFSGRFPMVWPAVAASLVLVAALWVFFGKYGSGVLPVGERDATEASTNFTAYLKLPDNKTVDLEKTGIGVVAQGNGITIIKPREGELVIRTETTVSKGPLDFLAFHEVSTPKAGQYLVHLADDTRVWLNAGSTLRFPGVFDQRGREVEVIGEAYFEVDRRLQGGKPVPFRVKSGHQLIEVLGTRFNVNSYADEDAIRTTLMEGSIRVKFTGSQAKEVLLKPGQELSYVPAGANKTEELADVRQVNTEAAVAWKNGLFRFDNTSLEELMRQICRWYNMEVEYRGAFANHEFVGEIERSAPLTEVLSILEVGNLSFHVEGRKIVVTDDDKKHDTK